ncbi:MAG: hypothetical protein FJ301_05300 [Planctomycetes bacterium]|nr:hypothetical protein [Planctomycetota bacterium]
MVLLLGGVGLVVVIALVVLMGGGNKDGDGGAASSTTKPAAAPTVATPAPAGKQGKAPTRPAPALAADMAQNARDLLAEAKTLSNEGVQARTAGNNELARQKQSAASDKCEAIKAMTATNWAWLEEAELEGWTMPGEYVDLGKLYTDLLNLENRIRKGGGTR